MKTPYEHTITAVEAFRRLTNGEHLSNYYITGELKVETTDIWINEVVLENCVVEFFSGAVTQFQKTVSLKNCHFRKCQFIFSYFYQGLLVDNCIFDDYLDFQAGGHNKIGKPIVITNNQFSGFVNFFDCWYNGEITVSNNRFDKGTNLLSEEVMITFDIPPLIENNEGKLDIDTEGV